MKESLFHVIIKAVGEAISGKTVKLVASNDVSLQAATNTSEKLENGVTLSYIQEDENPSFRKNADESYEVRAEGKMYDDMFLGVKGLGARIVNKLGINYHVTLTNKDVSLGTTIILDEMATLARAKYSNESNNERFIFVDTSDKVSVMPVSESKFTFVWTKETLGKSVVQNVLSEVGNQPWVGYVYYAENASKFTRTVAKVGGPVSIGFLLNDMQKRLPNVQWA